MVCVITLAPCACIALVWLLFATATTGCNDRVDILACPSTFVLLAWTGLAPTLTDNLPNVTFDCVVETIRAGVVPIIVGCWEFVTFEIRAPVVKTVPWGVTSRVWPAWVTLIGTASRAVVSWA